MIGGRPRLRALDALNAETPIELLGQETAAGGPLFVRSHHPLPPLYAESWTLEISGGVDGPRCWTLEELGQLPGVQLPAVLECAGNSRRRFGPVTVGELGWGDGAVGRGLWEGPSLSSLLTLAGAQQGSVDLVVEGADAPGSGSSVPPFVRSLGMERTLPLREAVVALRLDGRALSLEHGAPARLVVPGWYGMAWVKWLRSIRLQSERFRGHFQSERYIYRHTVGGREAVEPVERIRVKSLVIDPLEGARLSRGSARRIRGLAWSGSGPISRVEVDAGEGWVDARLLPGEGPFDWSAWQLDWTPTRPGPAIIRCRATDASGSLQPVEPFRNHFQYGYNAVTSLRVEVA